MGWYAYCIAERSAFPELAHHRRPVPLEGVPGLFGGQTFLFPAADLTVVVSEHLPEDAARMAGAEGAGATREHGRVERLRGKAEMHLKVMVDDICPEKELKAAVHAAGQAYLSNLRESATRQRERQSRARALSVQMHRMFLPLEEEITCKRMESGKMLLDIAHLVDKKTVERYQNKYSSATQQLKDCAMQLSGPWPPYHFVHAPRPHA